MLRGAEPREDAGRPRRVVDVVAVEAGGGGVVFGAGDAVVPGNIEPLAGGARHRAESGKVGFEAGGVLGGESGHVRGTPRAFLPLPVLRERE